MKILPYLALIVAIMTGSARADCWTDLQRHMLDRDLQATEADKTTLECQAQAEQTYKGSPDVSAFGLAMERCAQARHDIVNQMLREALDGRIECLKQTTGANNGH
jgi:hypothetical protein